MLDRMLNRGLTLALVALMTITGGGGLILLMTAWKYLLRGEWAGACASFGIALVSSGGVWWLCRHHEELKS